MLSLCLSATLQITLNQGLILVLRKALAPLTEIADEAIIKYSSEGIELMAMNTDSIIGVLKFRSLDFQHFVCNTEGIGWVDVHLLYKTLSFVDDEEYCSVIINYGRYDQIGFPGLQFVFKNCRTLKERYRRIELTEVDPEGFLLDESKTEYNLVAAIPSEEFRSILKHLSFFGPQVFIAITDKQVKFSASNAEIVLKKEKRILVSNTYFALGVVCLQLSECIIGGSAGDLPELTFEIEHIIPLMNASLLSNWVWILFSHDSFTILQLNFPVGALGNIMFYSIRDIKFVI
ncbi:proliferating cell nuclear antigen-like [Corylus avellana]|uniref:proliferating cell nuclear antigen-like n=1 Tax=Corylus avellana TaxID=13451 RepID=UPI00286B4845|nr:proliferating cell nuclear antigen-like [Corylus avellana]